MGILLGRCIYPEMSISQACAARYARLNRCLALCGSLDHWKEVRRGGLDLNAKSCAVGLDGLVLEADLSACNSNSQPAGGWNRHLHDPLFPCPKYPRLGTEHEKGLL